jgi:16S rRNA C967 or C1407 C5-methylase (RsmB/RsmF family)
MLEEHTGTREHYLVREKERDLPEQVDLLRLHASRELERSQKAEAGQFLTPAPLARFMASLLQAQSSSLRMLDAGAGVGSLFAACVADLCMRKTPPKQIHVVAYEIDAKLIAPLQETLRLCRSACEQTKSLQIPNGYYVLVKRFTAKEEKKRLVAALYNPIDFSGASIAFENHLNYFHCNGKGLDPALARGLAAYLNSTLVDAFFRLF